MALEVSGKISFALLRGNFWARQLCKNPKEGPLPLLPFCAEGATASGSQWAAEALAEATPIPL
jgi:hypothetical protein